MSIPRLTGHWPLGHPPTPKWCTGCRLSPANDSQARTPTAGASETGGKTSMLWLRIPPTSTRSGCAFFQMIPNRRQSGLRRLSKVRIRSSGRKALLDRDGLRARKFLVTSIRLVESRPPNTLQAASRLAWSLDIPSSGGGNPEAPAALRKSSARRVCSWIIS